MTLKTKLRDDDRFEGVPFLSDAPGPIASSAIDAPRVEEAVEGLSAEAGGLVAGAARRARRPILVPAADRNPVWITTACGQRFCTDQIGSMFGRE